MSIPENYELISLDVVSLFTNLHADLIISGIKKKWLYLRNRINLSLNEFIEGIKTLLSSTYFKFDSDFFQQLVGSPMGGNSSPWFAEIALEELENNCLKELGDSELFYRRYVDDCFLVIKNTDTGLVFNTFNNFNKFLKFTIEEEIDKKLNYLDILMLGISANDGLQLPPIGELEGSLMWGNSSPWFAEIALEELENNCLKELGDSVLFY